MRQPDLLDFENPKFQKGYEWLDLTKDNIKKNIGKRICLGKVVDHHRGYVRVIYGTIAQMRYSQIIFENGDSVDIRDWKEAGIKIEE